MRNKYYEWLVKLVCNCGGYSPILKVLHSVKFRPLVANDDNREEDGKKLREEFVDLHPEFDEADIELIMEGECSVLEMMMALSRRLEFETAQSRWEKSPEEWFWILVDNLGLTGVNSGERARYILQKFVNREYESNGNGGLFPLKFPKYDQRTIEIWYQMTEYIMENYPI